MCSLVFCKIDLFPALLQREKMFCKAAGSHADFCLILLYHTENMFWFVGNEIESFELYVRKSSDLVFRQKTRCLKLHNTENMFWLVGTKIGFFELYIAKSSVFAFCLLKHVALTQRSVCHKVVLFPWLLHGKKVFFQFAASHPAVLLILLKTTFFLVIG